MKLTQLRDVNGNVVIRVIVPLNEETAGLNILQLSLEVSKTLNLLLTFDYSI